MSQDSKMQGDTKIRVLQITQSAGGIETYLLLLIRNINRDRFHISLVCSSDNGTLLEKASAMNIDVYGVSMVRHIAPMRDLWNLLKIIGIIKEQRPSIVHVHSSKAGVLGRLAAFFARVPCLYTPNAFAFLGSRGGKRWLYLSIERAMRPLTRLLVAVSPSEAIRATGDVHFGTEAVRIFSNSIETKNLSDYRRDDREGVPVLMMVGRLTHQKNPEMFVRVARKVKDRIERVKFCLVGSGYDDYQRDNICGMVNALDLAGEFSIQPWVDRDSVLKLMAKASVLVVPSRYDGLSYVAAEAGLLGKPVVATKVDGLVDVVVDGKTGFLVDIDDDQAMANRLICLLKDRRLREKMGRLARERIKRDFDISQNIRQLERIYEEVHHRARSERQGSSKPLVRVKSHD